MKARRIFAVAGALAAVLAVAGCPLTGLIPGTTPTPPPIPADTKLSGRFTFGGSAPSATGLKAQYRPAGVSARGDQKPDLDTQGYFFFNDPNIKVGDQYQMIWDDGGKIVESADINTMGLYVSDGMKAATGQTTVQWTADVKWEDAYGLAPKAQFTDKFSFKKVPNLDAEYIVSVFTAATGTDVTKTNPSACWSSTQGTAESVSWDKKCTAGSFKDTTPSGVDLYYQIKFTKTGTTWGGSSLFGQTKYVPFKI